MRFIAISLLFVSLLCAAETAVLVDGSHIVASRHEDSGPMIRLFTEAGIREIPAEWIERFEDGIVLPDAPVFAPVLAKSRPSLFAPTSPRKPVNSLILNDARRPSVPVAMVQSIIAAESGFNPDAISPRGAMGLMQVMPATAEQFGLDAGVPEENVEAGARYLRYLLDKYAMFSDSLRRVIAAYNAGPAAVDKHRGVPPFPETKLYVARVLALITHYRNE